MTGKNLNDNNKNTTGLSSHTSQGSRYFFHAHKDDFIPSVLYIEDNYSHILLVKRILEIIPEIQFRSAKTSEEGLRKAIKEKPDLVILDMRMPVMDGYEILNNLKMHPLTRHIPVIALSASAMRHEVEKGLSLGLNRYLTKPINIREFLNAVNDELAAVYFKSVSP